MTNRQKALYALILISVLWGSAGVVAKTLLSELDVYVILFYRFGIAAACIFPLFLHAHKPRGYLRVLIPFSLLNTFNAFFFYQGLARTTANAASIIGSSTPLLVTFLAWILISERPTRAKIAGIIIGLAGAFFILLLPVLYTQQTVYGNFTGNMSIIAANICYSLYIIGSRKFISSDTYSPVLTASINFFTTALVNGILALASNQRFIPPGGMQPGYLFLLLYASIPMTFVTFSLHQWVMKHVTASTASLKDYLQLLVGLALNILFLHEHFTFNYFIGSLLVITGVFVATGQHISKKLFAMLKPVH